MESNDLFANITCLVYSYDGTGELMLITITLNISAKEHFNLISYQTQ